MKRFRLSSQGETGLPQFGSLQQAPPESNVSMTRAIPTPGKPAAGASGHSRPGSAANGQQSGIMPAPSLHEMNRIVTLFNPPVPEDKKLYCYGYLWQRVELRAEGKSPPPGHPEAQWTKWYVQLTGAELSLWSVEKMELAVKEGRTVGPTFLKLTDAFVSAVDTRTIPRAAKPPAQCEWVFSLNNASSNRILFAPEPEPQSGQSPLEAVKMWINCIRLAEWEYSRLNNIFTGTLLGLRGETAQRSPLVKGRFEDWIQVRIPGENEWRRAYLVVSDGTAPAKSKRRLSSFMTLSSSQQSNLAEASASGPSAALYASKRSKKPFITYHKITTAQAVFPESEKLIQTTPIARMEGLMDWDDSDFPEVPDGLNLRAVEETYKLACGKAEDHGVCIFMPDGEAATQDRQGSMLKCVLALTDAFELFGRKPPSYKITWDPRMPESPYFAYPVGPTRSRLFFDVPLIAQEAPWTGSPVEIHKTFDTKLLDRMRNVSQRSSLNASVTQQEGRASPARRQPDVATSQPPQDAPTSGPSNDVAVSERGAAPPVNQLPMLAPLSGSSGIDMDSFLARSPSSPKEQTPGSPAQPQTASTLTAKTPSSEKPKLAAIQTSDSVLYPSKKAPRQPSPSMLPYDRNATKAEVTAQKPKAHTEASSRPPDAPSRPPVPAASDRKMENDKKHPETISRAPSGPKSLHTLPSAYSQSSGYTPSTPEAPPLADTKPLFASNPSLLETPGSLGLVQPATPKAAPTAAERKELPPSPPLPVPSRSDGQLTPSPALPIPGSLPVSSQEASVHNTSSGVASTQPSSSPGRTEPSSPRGQPEGTMLQPSAPSESTFGTPLYEQQKKATPDLQRQVSSSMGHGGLDEYAAYMSWPESPQAKAPATSPQKLPQKKQPPSTSEREAEPIQLDSSSPPNDLYGSAASPVFETKVEAPKGPQPSTFARGKGENRRDATQLAKEAQSKHLHKPGRPNAPATQTKSQVRGAWADSDESEEESEEEESDDELPQSQSQLQEPSRPARLSQVPQTVEPIQQKEQGHLPKNNVLSQSNGGTSLGLGHAQQQPSNEYSQRSERHASRSLPIPPGQSQSDERVASGGALSQRQASGSPPLHRQPIPRSPSALNRMQQLQVEADETPQRPQSQHRQSFMSMSYPGGQDFQQRPATETQRASFMQHPDDLTGVAGFSADGMLQAGLKNRHDRSAREREAAAREMGGPMVDLSQTDRQKEMGESGGLVGALAERDRQKQRDGGLRAAQRKAGEGTVQQQLMQQQQAAMSHATQMHSLMGGPTWLPPGSRGSPSPGPQTNHPMYHSVMTNNYNPGVMDPYLNPNNMQQYIIQQQAMLVAQQAYVNTLNSYMMNSPQMGANGPSTAPSPSHSPQMSMGHSPQMSMGHSSQMSMYPPNSNWGNPYMGMPFPNTPPPVQPDWQQQPQQPQAPQQQPQQQQQAGLGGPGLPQQPRTQ